MGTTHLAHAAAAWTGSPRDLERFASIVGERRLVLLGEASHGTHEFYAERARITRFLIEHMGFHAVAWEADWPDAHRVDRFVRALDHDAQQSLDGFSRRFPEWMWRNHEVLSFVTWLRMHNDRARQPAGVYGLDLYSLHESIAAVLATLQRLDPELANRARQRYACFETFGEDPQAYGYATAYGIEDACRDQVVAELLELQHAAAAQRVATGEDWFDAEQNARLVQDAEAYYRAMFAGRVTSWNVRDRHMVDSLAALEQHLFRRLGRAPKIAVWAHNSHLGDATATEMGEHGEWNVGQLVRARWGDAALLVGQTTFTGTVTAATDWDTPTRHMRVRPGLHGSIEALLHDLGVPRVLLDLREDAVPELRHAMLERAIGVVYRPQTERASHYFRAVIARQFDVLLHLDETRALQPLDPGQHWHDPELPDTFPFGV